MLIPITSLLQSGGHYKALENMLRDRLVCGLRDSKTQRRLLAESQLTFTKALEIAQGQELADKSGKDLKPESMEESVHILKPEPAKKQRTMPAGTSCYRCGKNHASKCRFAAAICRACGKMGHIARACRTRRREAQTQRRPESSANDEEQGNPSSKTEGSQESNVYTLFH